MGLGQKIKAAVNPGREAETYGQGGTGTTAVGGAGTGYGNTNPMTAGGAGTGYGNTDPMAAGGAGYNTNPVGGGVGGAGGAGYGNTDPMAAGGAGYGNTGAMGTGPTSGGIMSGHHHHHAGQQAGTGLGGGMGGGMGGTTAGVGPVHQQEMRHDREPGLKGAAARAAEKIEMGMERATAKIKGQPAPNQQVAGTGVGTQGHHLGHHRGANI